MNTTLNESAVETAVELIPPAATAAELFVPNGLDKIIASIRAEVANHVPDISTEKGRKEIASLARKVASSKTRLDDYGKEFVAKIKVQTVAVDAERKRMRDILDNLRDETRKPLTDWENTEKDRVQGHEDALLALAALAAVPMGATLEDIARRLDTLSGYDEKRDWQEFSKRAETGYLATYSSLVRLQQETERAIKDAAELASLRAAEAERALKQREQALMDEAAEQATKVAEERVRKAEEDKNKAIADVLAATDRERKRVAEVKRVEDEATAKREANKKHVAQVNHDAATAILALGVEATLSIAIVEAIASGNVPSVRITY